MPYNGDWAFKLDNTAPPLGEVLQGAIARKDRNDERQYSLNLHQQERERQRQQQNRLYNLREIDGDTDPSKFITGEEAFDGYIRNELLKIKQNGIANYVNLAPEEAEMRLANDMGGIIQFHGAGKSAIKQLNTQLQEFGKTYQGADLVKAHNMAFDALANNMMARDVNGNWVRKPAEFIKPMDYGAELTKPSNLGLLYGDNTSGFQKHLHGLEKSTVSDSDYSNIKGFGKKTKWSAVTTPYTNIQPDRAGMPVLDVNHSTLHGVNGGDGKPMKFADEGVINGLRGDPDAWGSILGMWGKEKPVIEANLGRTLNPSEEDFKFKKFVYDQVKQYAPHGVKTEQVQVVPKPPKITVNVNGGGAGGAPMIDVFREIGGKVASDKSAGYGYTRINALSAAAQSSIISLVRSVNSGKVIDPETAATVPLDNSDLYVMDKEGQIVVMRKIGDKPNRANDQEIIPLNEVDANMKANQTLGIKSKRKVAMSVGGSSNAPTPSKSKKDDPLGILGD